MFQRKCDCEAIEFCGSYKKLEGDHEMKTNVLSILCFIYLHLWCCESKPETCTYKTRILPLSHILSPVYQFWKLIQICTHATQSSPLNLREGTKTVNDTMLLKSASQMLCSLPEVPSVQSTHGLFTQSQHKTYATASP